MAHTSGIVPGKEAWGQKQNRKPKLRAFVLMVGRMYGWGDGVKTLPLELVLVVTRRNLVSDLMTRFGLSGHSVWDMVDSTPEEIAEGVVSAFFDTKGEEH